MTNPSVSKRTQELAADFFTRAPAYRNKTYLAATLEQYGRDVREAAARVVESTNNGWHPHDETPTNVAAKTIREMDLP